MSEQLPEPAIEKPDETPIMLQSAPNQDEVKKKNKKDFWLGVGLWFLLNWLVLPLIGGVIFFVMTDYASPLGQAVILLVYYAPFVINIGLMIYFAIKRPQLALGMLAGFGFALAIVVCLGVLFMAACFIWPPRF